MATALAAAELVSFVDTEVELYKPRWVWREDVVPRTGDCFGEQAVAQILDSRRIKWLYEPWEYPLQFRHGQIKMAFRPDFFLPETRNRPALHIEVTGMRPIERIIAGGRNEYESRKLKCFKIHRTLDIYKIDTVLIDQSVLRRVKDDYAVLDRLIAQAASHA